MRNRANRRLLKKSTIQSRIAVYSNRFDWKSQTQKWDQSNKKVTEKWVRKFESKKIESRKLSMRRQADAAE